MGFEIDPQIGTAMFKLLGNPADMPKPPAAGDWQSRRTAVNQLLAALGALQPMPTDVSIKTFETKARDGHTIALRWYTKKGAPSGPACLYIHGGGMILGSAELYDGPVARYVSGSGVPMLSVEYRLAPEHPQPTLVEDCYAGLTWLAEHAGELGVDRQRIGIMGDSAGGGLAAGLALYARDHGGPAIAKQILIYPMLDDRTTKTDALIAPFAVWSYDDNITGWGAYLGKASGGAEVPAYAAPARAKDVSKLPSAYIEVGELDIFRDEDVEYARRLSAAGVSTELHVHTGAPHAFEAIAPDSDVARRSRADRLRYLKSL